MPALDSLILGTLKKDIDGRALKGPVVAFAPCAIQLLCVVAAAGLLDYWIVGLLDCQVVGIPDCWIA